jgi:RNA polymerase sigma-70 factor (ECF subfamily)
MSDESGSELDCAVRARCARGEFQAAAVLILERVGSDVMRVIHARLRDADASAEVFSRFAEALWRALPAFAFRCSVRVWAFTLARNAGNRYLGRELRRARKQVALEDAPALAARVAQTRTQTLAHLRTENRDRIAQLRDALDEPDQLLLTLRIHHRMEFREIAQVMLGEGDHDDARVVREAARLRKRLQLVKEQLKKRIQAASRAAPPASTGS